MVNPVITNSSIASGIEPQDQRLLTIEEVARFTSLSVGTLYHMVSQGRIPVVRISRRCIRFRLSELLRWIEGRSANQAEIKR